MPAMAPLLRLLLVVVSSPPSPAVGAIVRDTCISHNSTGPLVEGTDTMTVLRADTVWAGQAGACGISSSRGSALIPALQQHGTASVGGTGMGLQAGSTTAKHEALTSRWHCTVRPPRLQAPAGHRCRRHMRRPISFLGR